MQTSEQAMLADTFPPEKRPQAFALYGIAVIVAPTVGPTLGGWITDKDSATSFDAAPPPDTSPEPPRREFLYIATATVIVVGAVATLVPLVDQMNPDASTLAAGGPVDLDVSKVEPGQQVVIRCREHLIFVFHRTPQNLETLRGKQLLSELADPNSQQLQQPTCASNWHRSIRPEFGVLVEFALISVASLCSIRSSTRPRWRQIWLGGYFCPCHGSKYDCAGRVFSGAPAPYNLPIMPYRFVTDATRRRKPARCEIRFCLDPPALSMQLALTIEHDITGATVAPALKKKKGWLDSTKFGDTE